MNFDTARDALRGFERHVVRLDLAILRPATSRTKRGFVPDPSVGVLRVGEPRRRDDSAVGEAAHWYRLKREVSVTVGSNAGFSLRRDRFQNAFWQGDAFVIRYPGWYWRITRPRLR